MTAAVYGKTGDTIPRKELRPRAVSGVPKTSTDKVDYQRLKEIG